MDVHDGNHVQKRAAAPVVPGLVSVSRMRYQNRMNPSFQTGATDPILEAIRNAVVGAPFADDERAELDQAVQDIAAGKVTLVRHDDVPAWLEARAQGDTSLAAE